MHQFSSANDEMMREMVCEGVSGVLEKHGDEQYGWCEGCEMRLSITNKCYNINLISI